MADALACGQRRAGFIVEGQAPLFELGEQKPIALEVGGSGYRERPFAVSFMRLGSVRLVSGQGLCLMGATAVAKHLLSGDYRVFYDEECIAWASGSRPNPSTSSNKNNDQTNNWGDSFTLRGDIFTSL